MTIEERDTISLAPHPPVSKTYGTEAQGAVGAAGTVLVSDGVAAPEALDTDSSSEANEEGEGSQFVSVRINGKLRTFERVNDTDTFLRLYRTLNETQKRVIRMRQPHDTNRSACARAGVSDHLIHAWLWSNPKNEEYSENFRRLWYSIRYPDDVVETMTYVANLLGERNLWRLEDIASLSEQWASLKKEDKVEARKAVERLATLPFERHDKAKEMGVSGFAEAWFKLLAEKRAMVVEASVVDVEVTQ